MNITKQRREANNVLIKRLKPLGGVVPIPPDLLSPNQKEYYLSIWWYGFNGGEYNNPNLDLIYNSAYKKGRYARQITLQTLLN